MTRMTTRRYQRQSMAAMVAYVALLLLVWPLARTADGLTLKMLAALAPVVPMLWLFVLMARHIRDSDELEQRMHLMALGVATVVTAVFSLIGGFLATAHVVALDGSVLVWVFPLMMASYGIARMVLVQRYGGEPLACAGTGIPLYQRLLLVAFLMGGVALVAWTKNDMQAWGVFCGMACVFAVFGVLLGWRRWYRWRHRHEDGEHDHA